jgi:hypothetical protein
MGATGRAGVNGSRRPQRERPSTAGQPPGVARWQSWHYDMEIGPYIQTVTGRRINPFAPDLEEIVVDDIANALANQCRFGGHCRHFYSVAQHSSLVADLVARQGGNKTDVLWALLHDAAEAYLTDLPHPLKHHSELGKLFRQAEARLQDAICRRFALPLEPPPLLKDLDRRLLAAERRALMLDAWDWPELAGVEPADITIEPWSPERSAREFLGRYAEIAGLDRPSPSSR